MSKTKFQEPNEPNEAEVLSTPPNEFAVQVGPLADLDEMTRELLKLRESPLHSSPTVLGSISIARPTSTSTSPPPYTGSDIKRSLELILENQMRQQKRLLDIETTLKTLIVITSTPPTP